MDVIDKEILRYLAENSTSSASQLSGKVNLSVPAINKRIAKLKAGGVINKFSIVTQAKLVGKPIIAFILITLNSYTGSEELIKLIESDPDFLELYAITGEYDYIAKVCAASIEELEEKIILIKNKKCVNKSNTLMGLMEHKFESAALP